MSSRARAQASNDWDFAEFWIDPSAHPPYALLLLGRETGPTQILDPSKKYRVLFSADSYDDAKSWLLEDEYERVEGRLLYSQV